MATFEAQSDLIVQQIRDRTDSADLWLQQTKDLLSQTRTALTTAVSTLTSIGLSFNVAGVDTAYVPPADVLTFAENLTDPVLGNAVAAPTVGSPAALAATPTAPSLPAAPTVGTLPTFPTLPTAPTIGSVPSNPAAPVVPGDPTLPSTSTVAIGDTEWDRIFGRAADDITRKATTDSYQASNQASLRGAAVPAVVQSMWASMAVQEALRETASLRRDNAVNHATSKREDVFKAADQSIQFYQAKSGAQIDYYRAESDAERQTAVAQADILLREYQETSRVLIDSYNAELKSVLEPAQIESQIYQTTGTVQVNNFIALAQNLVARYSAEATALNQKGSTEAQIFGQTVSQIVDRYTAEANAEREGFLARWRQVLDEYSEQYKNKIASEQARLGYERLELEKIVEPARLEAEFDLKSTEIALQNSTQELVELVQVYAQVTNALFAASDVGLSSSTGISLSGAA